MLLLMWMMQAFASDATLSSCVTIEQVDRAQYSELRSAGDMDGDGVDDILVEADLILGGESAVLLSAHGWQPMVLRRRLTSVFRFHVTRGDFNGDGIADLVAMARQQMVSEPRRIEVYFGPFGPGDFDVQAVPEDASLVATRDPFRFDDLVAADFDGDGLATLAFVNNAQYLSRVWLWDRVLTTGTHEVFDSSAPAPGLIELRINGIDAAEELTVIEDFDGDGLPELGWFTIDFYGINERLILPHPGTHASAGGSAYLDAYRLEAPYWDYPLAHQRDMDGDGLGDLVMRDRTGAGWVSSSTGLGVGVVMTGSLLQVGWEGLAPLTIERMFPLQVPGRAPLVVVDVGRSLVALPSSQATQPRSFTPPRHRLLETSSRSFYRAVDGHILANTIDVDGVAGDELVVLMDTGAPGLEVCIMAL